MEGRSAGALNAPSTAQEPSDFIRFEWGDSVHNVPEGNKMPQENVASLWRFWIFGYVSKDGPCLINRKDHSCQKRDTS